MVASARAASDNGKAAFAVAVASGECAEPRVGGHHGTQSQSSAHFLDEATAIYKVILRHCKYSLELENKVGPGTC